MVYQGLILMLIFHAVWQGYMVPDIVRTLGQISNRIDGMNMALDTVARNSYA